MNKNIALDLATAKGLYESHKKYLIPIVMIVASLLLFFVALVPQFNDLLTTLAQRNEALRKLQIEKNNLTILSNIDEDSLSSQLLTSSRALPQAKDFESVLTAIANVGAQASVSLGNFEFKVGDLTKSEAGLEQFPALTISLIVNDGVAGSTRFIEGLAASLPLSEVKSIDINGGYSNLTLNFYYKTSGFIKTSPDAPIVPLSSKQTELLSLLASWDTGNIFPPLIPASNSATTPF